MRSRVVDGVVEKKTSVVYGRKIPLTEVRAKLLQKQEKYMHLLSDEVIDSMEICELKSLSMKTLADTSGDLRSQFKSLHTSLSTLA